MIKKDGRVINSYSKILTEIIFNSEEKIENICSSMLEIKKIFINISQEDRKNFVKFIKNKKLYTNKLERFLIILLERNYISIINDVITRMKVALEQLNDCYELIVCCNDAIDKTVKDNITYKIHRLLPDMKYNIKFQFDNNISSGFIIKFSNIEIDCSLKAELKMLKQRMLQA